MDFLGCSYVYEGGINYGMKTESESDIIIDS